MRSGRKAVSLISSGSLAAECFSVTFFWFEVSLKKGVEDFKDYPVSLNPLGERK